MKINRISRVEIECPSDHADGRGSWRRHSFQVANRINLPGRTTEPVVVEHPEIAVAVGRAAVPQPTQICERGGIGYVWRVVVQSSGGIVGDIHRLSATGGVRVVLDVAGAAGPKIEVRGRGPIRLHLSRAPIDLIEEPVILRSTGATARVWAAHAHSALQSLGRWTQLQDETLFFLQRHEDDLGANTADLLHFEDNRGGEFSRRSRIRLTLDLARGA